MLENNNDSRVLSRFGARELSQAEIDYIFGGFSTKCSLPPPGGCPDWDCSVCGP